MRVIPRAFLCIASMLCTVGCQVCNTAFKRACGEETCGNEIHVKAPPQKVVVHRGDCPPSEEACAGEKPGVEAKAPAPQPTAAAGRPAPQQMMMVGQAAPQQPMAATGAPAGYAAIPTLPMNTALTLTFDVIRIPIPIPRLRTIDVPPESKLTYVQVGAAPAVGAVGAAPMAVAPQAAYVQQAAAVQAAGGDECIRPEHIAAAAAILRSQNSAGRSAAAESTNSAATAVGTDPRLKLVEELERRCDELEKQKAAKKEAADGWGPSSRK